MIGQTNSQLKNENFLTTLTNWRFIFPSMADVEMNCRILG